MPKAFRISTFGGMVPRQGRRGIQNDQAQVATNVRLTSGQLEPLREVVLTDNPNMSGILSIYKLRHDGVDYWLTWDSDANAAKGPIAGDQTNRTYFTSDSFEPRVTDFDLATVSTPYPTSWYVLGVTPPTTKASLSHSGGSGTAVDRSFCYTFVTQWGEESKPSPATDIVTGKTDGTWTIGGTTGMDTAPPNTYTVSAAAWSGGVLTLTVGSTFGLRAGEYVTLSGLAPSSLNASWKVATVPNSTTITIEMDDPGSITDQTGTATRDAPHNTTGMTKNIYWTESTVSGTAFQLVKSGVPVATTSTTVDGDTEPQEEIETTFWEMPPVDLQGILFHPSGAAVGFTKNQVCFSVPYSPYAWPVVNQFAVDYDVVGIGIYAATVVVMTKANPYLADGVDPDSVTLTKMDLPWPCLSKRGIVNVGYGVLYPAPQGLVMVGVNGSQLVTQNMYTQLDWQALNPDTFRAAAYGNRYVASYDPGSGNRQILLIDPPEYASVTTANRHADVVYGDQQTGKLFIVNSDDISEWDSNSGSLLTYDWMSKEIVPPEVFSPGAAKLDAEFTLTPEENAALAAARAIVTAANEAIIAAGSWTADGGEVPIGVLEIGGVSFPPAPSDTSDQLQFQLWVNNELYFTKALSTDRAFRLPAGIKPDALAVRIAGNVRVLSAVIGETMLSLKSV